MPEDPALALQDRLKLAHERYIELAGGEGYFGTHGRVGLKSIDEFAKAVRGLTTELDKVPPALRDPVREMCVPCFDVGLSLFEVHQAALRLLKGLSR
jgi:hypothetical protein